MASPPDPPKDANPFVNAVLGTGVINPPRLRPDGRGKVRKLIGFLAEAQTDKSQPRRLFTDRALDRGVDIPVDAIKFWAKVPANRKDGLERDALWVADDADLLYFSRTPPRRDDDPEGGDGFPFRP